MQKHTLLAAALAAGSLMGLASIANATPAVVAGATVGVAPAVVATPGTYPSGTTIVAPADATITVQAAPPAAPFEAVPAPRHGYVWAPGHYEWHHGRYVWIGGSWLQSRPGYAWEAAHWHQRPDGSWTLVAGHWVAGDRVARNGPYGDRDGDGVPNRYDAHPNNPYRD
jgi:hypothetical protein